jgi:aryl-alcohol dehydrogenase-like predicted oxidoreductase
MKETFAALERLVREGKVRYIGTSNFHPILLRRASGLLRHEEIVANEIEYNVVSRFSEKYTVPYCVDNRIGVITFSPLAGGILTGMYGGAGPPRDRARAFNFTANLGFFQRLSKLQGTLRRIAGQKGCTVPQLALAWILMHKPCVPIPASLHPEEAVANAAAADVSLLRAELEEIDRVTPSVGLLRYAFDHFAIRPISWTKEAARHYKR